MRYALTQQLMQYHIFEYAIYALSIILVKACHTRMLASVITYVIRVAPPRHALMMVIIIFILRGQGSGLGLWATTIEI